jgi:hypothetical protein
LESDAAIGDQFVDITNLIQDQRDLSVQKKESMDARWEENRGRPEEKDSRLAETRNTIARILEDHGTDRLRTGEERAAAQERPG